MAAKTPSRESTTAAKTTSGAEQDNHRDNQNDEDLCFSSHSHNAVSSLMAAGSLAWVETEFHKFYRRHPQQRRLHHSSSLQSHCDESRLVQENVPYNFYSSQEFVLNSEDYVENLWDNALAYGPIVMPSHHRVDAKYEILMLRTLMNHSLRVHQPKDVQLFVIPVPFSTIAHDGGTKLDAQKKRRLYQHLFNTLRRQAAFTSDKPHVLVAMTSRVFSCFTTKSDQRQVLIDLYHNRSKVSVARGDDFLA